MRCDALISRCATACGRYHPGRGRGEFPEFVGPTPIAGLVIGGLPEPDVRLLFAVLGTASTLRFVPEVDPEPSALENFGILLKANRFLAIEGAAVVAGGTYVALVGVLAAAVVDWTD